MNPATLTPTPTLWQVTPEDATRAVHTVWEKASAKPIVLFGAGGTGKEVLAALRARGITPQFFAEDSTTRAGQKLEGVEIISTADIASRVGRTGTIIVCIFLPHHAFAATKARVQELLPDACILPFYTALAALGGDDFSHYFFSSAKAECARLAIMQALYEHLADDASRRTLIEHLQLRLFHASPSPAAAREDIPLPAQALSNPLLTYVDGGAYDGDTLGLFLKLSGNTFRKAIALEPDPTNAHKIRTYFSTLPQDISMKLELVNKGVWRESGEVSFAGGGNMAGAISDKGETRIPVTSLDDLLAGEPAPYFIKLDVEGSEMAALEGAHRTIRTQRPLLAIAVYHTPSDLADVYAWLESAGCNYTYGLRCYGGDGTDLMLFVW